MRRLVSRYAVDLALVGVAAVWGFTFVTVKEAVSSYPPFSFLAVRFVIACLALLVLFPRIAWRLSLKGVGAGAAAGAFLTIGYVGQTLGLMEIDASRAGFITGMFVVITPILQLLVLRRPPHAYALAGVTLATTGLALLSLDGTGGWSFGDTFVLAGAVGFSGHFIVLGAVSRKHPIEVLAFAQVLTTAIACAGAALVVEDLVAPTGVSLWTALVVTGVIATAVAFAVQTYAQRHVSPTRTALILITEPVFAGLFGFLLAGEVLGVWGWVGSGLIFSGMLVSEVFGNLRRAKEPLPLDA
jgi:drug/metabolite transporter (DMT)-like permease